MLYYPVTLNNKVNMLIHERIRQDQNLKNKIIKEKKILQYKQNENIIMKIRDWLNSLFHLVYRNIKSIYITILFIILVFSQFKKIPKIFKWILEFCKKRIQNYRSR